MVCYVGFGVWFACSWNVVGNRVVHWLPAYMTVAPAAAHMLPHTCLHGGVALPHAAPRLLRSSP